MALPKRELSFTPEEYLAFEREAKTRHEYLDGQIYTMAGGSPPHNQICFNTADIYDRVVLPALPAPLTLIKKESARNRKVKKPR